ncbi:MAG: NAD(P)-dependent oxidoreductase [Cytophaga sp.]|nr:NAD(P)-dependent oxidoreductase [Undibacterium sp.]
MRIAIFGSTSLIAKDLIQSFAAQCRDELVLYARHPETVKQWLTSIGLSTRYAVADFGVFSVAEQFDVIFNFVGVGNPAQAAAMGAVIFEVTLKYDEMALDYVRQHPNCRYIFLSSGAAYGTSFDAPVDENTKASISINSLQQQDWYAIAKLHAECRHRALPHLAIIDIRVFNYFSHTQNMDARFLVTDIFRAVRDKTVLQTSSDYIVRDFLHPSDFHQLTRKLIDAPAMNTVVDCYSRAPIDKPTLLTAMQDRFNLIYKTVPSSPSLTATGNKPYYYSTNRRAASFGFEPMLSSLEGIIQETLILLQTKS